MKKTQTKNKGTNYLKHENIDFDNCFSIGDITNNIDIEDIIKQEDERRKFILDLIFEEINYSTSEERFKNIF